MSEALPRLGADFPVFLRPQFAEPDECRALVKHADEDLGDECGNTPAVRKFDEVLAGRSPRHADLKRRMNLYRYSAIHQVRGHFDGVGRALPSTTMLTRWTEGQNLAPHCDTDTWWRTYTTITYLNDEFTGGELEFVRLGYTLRPRAGLLVAFRCDDRLTQHQVRPVTSGRRYTITTFVTDQLSRVEL